MPQAIHHSTRIQVQFASGAVLQRPELAMHIALVSGQYNEIEARINAFLAALLGTEAVTGIPMFLAVTNDGAKRAMIDSISASKLAGTDHTRFLDLLKTIGSRYADRNKVVHGAWGISPVYPDALIWLDIRSATILHAEMMHLTSEHARRERLLAEQKKMRVYVLKDFLEIEERMEKIYDDLCEFTRPFMERAFGLAAKVDLKPTLIPRPRAKPLDPDDC